MSDTVRQTVEVDGLLVLALINIAKSDNTLPADLLTSLEIAIKKQLSINVEISLGDIVTPITGRNYLRSGDTAHDKVVVISLDPFIVTTIDGKAMWKEQLPENFVIIGKAK